MSLDRFARDLSDCGSAARCLVAQPGIELVGQLHRRAFHGMPAYPSSLTDVNSVNNPHYVVSADDEVWRNLGLIVNADHVASA